MSSNNGQRLVVFGLTFAQHDSRKMQQVLRHYNRLPGSPGSRALLFVQLQRLARELVADGASQESQQQAQQLTDWMRDGGDFPLGEGPAPVNAAIPSHDGGNDRDRNREQTDHSQRVWDGVHGPGRFLDDAVSGDDGHEDVAHEDDNLQENYGWMNDAGGEDGHGDMSHWTDDMQQDSSAWDLRGPGRTLNDTEEATNVTEVTDQPDQAGHESHNSDEVLPEIPQLRNDQAWRGNNVVGPRDTTPMARAQRLAYPGLPPPNQLIQGLLQGRGTFIWGPGMRPRMGDDDDEDFTPAPRPFGFGRGRALNDLEPTSEESQAAGGAVDNPTANSNSIDEADPDSNRDLLPELVPLTATAGPEEDGAEEIECTVCLGEFPPSRFPQRDTVTELCDHPDKACLQCLDASISAVLERGALHLLVCPICPQKLTQSDIKEYANKELYKRYEYLKQQSEIPGHWISCTSTSCGGSQEHDSETPDGPKMTCNHCGFLTCAKHRRPWHQGQTCDEFDRDPEQIERLEEEEATAKLLAQESTSICPKCGQGVTKTAGCDHMMCQCGTEWCYVCSCSWENVLRFGEVGHATFCIYHPNKVNLTKAQKEKARARIMGLVHGGEVSAELARARDEFRQRRREEMRPKLAEAAEARRKKAMEDQDGEGTRKSIMPTLKKRKVKLVSPWEEGGRTKKAL